MSYKKKTPLSVSADWDSDEDELLDLIIDEWTESETAAASGSHRKGGDDKENRREDQIILKQRDTMMRLLRESVEDLVAFYTRERKAVDAEDNLFKRFLKSLEGALTFGIWVEGSARRMRINSSSNDISVPQTELEVLWRFLLATSKEIPEEEMSAILAAKSLPDIKTDAGRVRAWMRLSLIDHGICQYIEAMLSHPDTAAYHRHSVMRSGAISDLLALLQRLRALDLSMILNFDWCTLDEAVVPSVRPLSKDQQPPMANISPGLIDEKWFHGRITTSHAATVLEPNYFLVRESTTTARAYTVSVNSGEGVKNFRIQQDEEGMFYFNSKQRFITISRLIDFYSTHGIKSSSGGSKMLLNQPCLVTRPGHRKPTSEKPWIAPAPVENRVKKPQGDIGSEVQQLKQELARMKVQMDETNREVAELRETNAKLMETPPATSTEISADGSVIGFDDLAAPDENTDFRHNPFADTEHQLANSLQPAMAATEFEQFLAKQEAPEL